MDKPPAKFNDRTKFQLFLRYTTRREPYIRIFIVEDLKKYFGFD